MLNITKIDGQLLNNKTICNSCFRPFKINNKTGESNRLYRWQVMLEIISFYIFKAEEIIENSFYFN